MVVVIVAACVIGGRLACEEASDGELEGNGEWVRDLLEVVALGMFCSGSSLARAFCLYTAELDGMSSSSERRSSSEKCLVPGGVLCIGWFFGAVTLRGLRSVM